jgi:hypothetical protein
METSLYVLAQISGGIGGAIVAHMMFELPIVSLSQHARSGPAQWFSEFIATFGLLSVIWGCSRTRVSIVPFAVGAYITAAYWFTASTSFANPAVTIARCLSDTFAGIRPIDVPWFVVAQFAGGFAATIVFRWLVPNLRVRAKDVLVAHDSEPTRPVVPSASAQDCWLLKKGETTTIEFIAQTHGTYPFRCCHKCGLGHSGMKGELIVE